MKLRFFHFMDDETPIYECDFEGWVPRKHDRMSLTKTDGNPVFKCPQALLVVNGVTWLPKKLESLYQIFENQKDKNTTMDEQLEIKERFLTTLQGVMKYRPKLRHFVTRPDGKREVAWMGLERHAMMSEVNRVRYARGLGLVGLDDIERIENYSTGADYASKVALRCAELALTP